MNRPAPQAAPRPSLLPVIIGLSLFGALILLAGLWSTRQPRPPSMVTVTLLSPSADTTTADSLHIQFETSGSLRLLPTGWGHGTHHLHALLGGLELMPGPNDIRPLGGNRYQWVLPPVDSTVTLRLIWAGRDHRRLVTGSSRAIQVTP